MTELEKKAVRIVAEAMDTVADLLLESGNHPTQAEVTGMLTMIAVRTYDEMKNK